MGKKKKQVGVAKEKLSRLWVHGLTADLSNVAKKKQFNVCS